MNNWLAMEVHCPHCCKAHLVPIEAPCATFSTETIRTTCPHCNEALAAVYELRLAVKYVRLQGRQYPQAWPLEAGW